MYIVSITVRAYPQVKYALPVANIREFLNKQQTIMNPKLRESLQEHLAVMRQLSSLEEDICLATTLVTDTAKSGRTVFICGNGGSAADAQHFAAELTGRYCQERRSYAGIALTVDTSALTAIANDYGYECVFSRQLEGLGKHGDVLIAISTSGTSPNIIEALKTAKEKGMKTIALSGKDGGKLAAMADIALVVPSDTTARIQEAHIFLLHSFCEGLEP